MEENFFKAVQDFVADLWEIHSSTKGPLKLYRSLLILMKQDKTSKDMEKLLYGFRKFFEGFDTSTISSKTIPKESKITFGKSERVYIDISSLMRKSSPENKEAILQHLKTIDGILKTPAEAYESSSSIDISGAGFQSGSKEEQFVKRIMKKAQDGVKDISTDDPTAAVMGLVSSGVIGEVVTSIKNGAESGEMDLRKLLAGMQGLLNGAMSDISKKADEVAPKVKEIEKPEE